MYRVDRNDYSSNPKAMDIETPLWVSKFIYDTISPFLEEEQTIIDPCVGRGNLLSAFSDNPEYKLIGIEKDESKNVLKEYGIQSVYGDFLLDDIEKEFPYEPDLVVCNPPFNANFSKAYVQRVKEFQGSKDRLFFPHVFLNRIFELWGETVPVILITPYTFRLNQRKHSKRREWLLNTEAEITGIIDLPLDTFENTQFHVEVLIFNLHLDKLHYIIPKNYWEGK